MTASLMGATGVVMYNTNGFNTFSNCYFTENVGDPNDPYPGGGGMYIEFSYCIPGQNSCANGTNESYTDSNQNSTYLFNNCTFSDNHASTGRINKTAPTFIIPFRQNHVAFSRGGGLSIFVNANATGNNFTLLDCHFRRNVAKYGAGMFVEFHDSSGGNSVVVNGSRFNNNYCDDVSGGGLRVAHFVYNRSSVENEGNSVEVILTQFYNNTAHSGGGMSIVPALQKAPDSELFSLLLQGSLFKENTAIYGAAMRVDPFGIIVSGSKPNITLVECTFTQNTVYYPETYTEPYEVGLGTVYISQVDIHIFGISAFIYNNGSALAIVASTAYFTNTTLFAINRGVKGGAIAMLGSSKIVVDQGTQLIFFNNIANKGGAIYNRYTSRTIYEDNADCFIAHVNPFLSHDEWKTVFTFDGNQDSRGKNAIYSTSILPCAISGDTGEETVRKLLCWNNWTYDRNKSCSEYIRTGPGHVDTEHPFSPISELDTLPITAYPGKQIQLSLRAFDDLNHTEQAVYTATVTNSSDTGYVGAKVDPYYSYVSQNALRLYQYRHNGTSALVYLDEVGDRAWRVEVNVELEECPPGLLPTHISCDSEELCITCECNTTLNYRETVHCNTETNASLASGYWMGKLNETDCFNESCLWVSQCPPGFCKSARSEFIVLPEQGLNEHICGPQNRHGILCGECKTGYGPSLNSETYDCVPCDLDHNHLAQRITYYILSLYVPLFLLFLVLIVFNVRLTTGPANAFILYSQVISSTFDLDASGRIPLSSIVSHYHNYDMAYKFPYGIFNLKFFEQLIPPQYLCLGSWLNVLDIMLLDYIVALTPLLMIAGVVILYKASRFSHCRPRGGHNQPAQAKGRSRLLQLMKRGRIGDAILPAFASFLLLSYTKFSLTSSNLSVTQNLFDASGKDIGNYRAYYAGQFSIKETTYIVKYYIPSILVFMTFVAIPPLLLLDYPLWIFEKTIIEKSAWIRRHYPKAKMHAFLDTFQGCYKNRWRCFAGLYFLFRLIINVTYINVDILQQYLLQGLYSTILALLVAYLKPYRAEFHLFNYVDSLMFLNLAVVNQISFYLYAYTRNGTQPPASAFAIQYTLVFLPLVYMVAYTVWCLLPIPNCRARAKEWLARRKYSQRMEDFIHNEVSATPEPTDDGVDWERARERNRYSPLIDSEENHESSTRVSTGRAHGGGTSDSGLAVSDKQSQTSYGGTGSTSTTTTVSFDEAIHQDRH